MKCFVVFSMVAALALGAYVPQDTAEVAAAKNEFYRAYQAQAAAAAASSPKASFSLGPSAPAAPAYGGGQTYNAAPSYSAPAPVQQSYNAAPTYSAPAASYAAVPAAAPAAYSDNFEDGLTYPEAEPYIHQEVPAEPYVHQEPARKRGGGASQTYNAAPAPSYSAPAPAAPAPAYNSYDSYAAAPAPAAAPVAYAAAPSPVGKQFYEKRYGGTCYNNLGEGVECRKMGQNY